MGVALGSSRAHNRQAWMRSTRRWTWQRDWEWTSLIPNPFGPPTTPSSGCSRLPWWPRSRQGQRPAGVGTGRRVSSGAMGAPVVAPLDLAGSMVHHSGRWTVTFWPYHAQTGVTPDPVALGRALERLHDVLDEAARREEWSLPSWDKGPHDVITRTRRRGLRSGIECWRSDPSHPRS